MAEAVADKLWSACKRLFLSLVNATLLLVLACLGLGIWGALEIEQAAVRTLIRTEQTLVSALAPQTDRLLEGLLDVETEIEKLGRSIDQLAHSVRHSPALSFPAVLTREAAQLVEATRHLTSEVRQLQSGDFHLSQESWKHIATTAGDVVATAIACQPRRQTEPGRDG